MTVDLEVLPFRLDRIVDQFLAVTRREAALFVGCGRMRCLN